MQFLYLVKNLLPLFAKGWGIVKEIPKSNTSACGDGEDQKVIAMVVLSDFLYTFFIATSYLNNKSWEKIADAANGTVCASVVFLANTAIIWSVTW